VTLDVTRVARSTIWLALASTGPMLWPAIATAQSEPAVRPWDNRALPADQRATLLVAQMTRDEKVRFVHGHYPRKMKTRPPGVPITAGWVPGVPRLGIPDLLETDASLGVAFGHLPNNPATALPSGLSLASTWNPKIAYEGGALIGKETRDKGYNVLLAGGVNLVREPRNGRAFEYLGEDPLLAGVLVGQSIKGIQTNKIVATIKHYVLNNQETGRMVLNVKMDDATMRESDLLAFQKGIEIGDPGSVMCAYNRINDDYACESAATLDILKKDWGWKGWVMSDWGAVHSTVKAIDAGLDQESGEELDTTVFFDRMLKDALATGAVPEAKLDGMVHRILRTLYAVGVMDSPVGAAKKLDAAAGVSVARTAATQGIVLLRNEANVLPITASARRIAVIGGHADIGVLSGGGSSQVEPTGTHRLPAPAGAPTFIEGVFYHPSSPLAALRAALPGVTIDFDDGTDPAKAAALARRADVTIVFATQFTNEGMDAAMALDGVQDRLIDTVARANPRTIIVLETGGPVAMPWLSRVPGVIQAWYPGGEGGSAIADIITGRVNPSGRLPVTFPASLAQLPNAELPGARLPRATIAGDSQPEPFDLHYPEGADVGYRWYARQGTTPLFPFGHGLSYTKFRHDGLVFDTKRMEASFRVTNTGAVAGTDTPQLYMTPPGEAGRLVGWARLTLAPGETRSVRLTLDPRFIAKFDSPQKRWVVAGGRYGLAVSESAGSIVKDALAVRLEPQAVSAALQPGTLAMTSTGD
jgi:beta-glucosidase